MTQVERKLLIDKTEQQIFVYLQRKDTAVKYWKDALAENRMDDAIRFRKSFLDYQNQYDALCDTYFRTLITFWNEEISKTGSKVRTTQIKED